MCVATGAKRHGSSARILKRSCVRAAKAVAQTPQKSDGLYACILYNNTARSFIRRRVHVLEHIHTLHEILPPDTLRSSVRRRSLTPSLDGREGGREEERDRIGAKEGLVKMSVTDESAVPPVEPMVGVTDVEKAHKRIKPFIHRTPLLTSITLDNLASQAIDRRSASRHGQDVTAAQSTATCKGRVHVRLAFKSEHLQRIGAFKMRGATNAVQTHLERLSHDRSSCAPGGRFDPSKLWVVTHSSGNHAAAVACAARSVGARAAVVMPRTAPAVKKAAVAGYGARIVECEPILAERERSAIVLMAELQAADPDNVVRFIHPYDEPLVIAGQGTLGLEMLEQAHELQSDGNPWRARSTEDGPVLDIVVAPVGGGGMLSGVATVVKGRDPQIHVIAAEPKSKLCSWSTDMHTNLIV